MTHVEGPYLETLETSRIEDDAKVLITIASSETGGMIRRWGVISRAIGGLSVEALLRGAVDDAVVSLLRERRPQQYDGEREITDKIKAILDSGYRVFVHDADDPIDSARAGQIEARSLLGRGHPDGESDFYVLHMTVEPFGASPAAFRRDEMGAASASDALREEMGLAQAQATVEPAALPGVGAAAACEGYQAAGESPASAHEQPARPDSIGTPAPEPDLTEALEKWPAPVVVLEAATAPSAQETLDEAPAQPKKHARKADALMEQFGPKIQALDFRGLFVGNFGFQRDTVVDVAKLSALSPQTISAYLMKANALRQSGEHEKALSYYRVLLKSDADNADYRFLYGKTLMEMGRVQAARECFERARELGHENAAHELEELENRQAKKPALAFLQFWRRAETRH